MTDLKHGTYACYTNSKCRCELCREAAREYMRKYRKTENGRSKTRRYTHLQAKRNNSAASWVRKNYPDIWKNICEEVTLKEKATDV